MRVVNVAGNEYDIAIPRSRSQDACMFRIKTDIRQYKCETKDKVEKLIRNWVIRPSDLIYNRDEREWLPIGEHPSFVGLFGMLAEQEKNTPDTVVTARSPYADRPAAPPADEEEEEEEEEEESEETSTSAGPGNVISEATADAESEGEEVTHIVQRPAALEEGSEAEEGGERETDEVDAASRAEVDKVSEEETADDENEDEAQDAEDDDEDVAADADDSRETDVFDQDDIAESVAESGRPRPPEAPEGVEPPVSADEVTMMTEKTLEMLKITDEEEAAEEDEKATDVRDRDEETAEVDQEEGETTNVVPSPLEEEEEGEADEEEQDEEEEGETTNVVPSPLEEDEEQDEDEEAEPDEEVADEDDRENDASPDPAPEAANEKKKGPKLGRHDLPEELFATNEISSPEVQEKIKTIDDLGELSEPSSPSEESTSNDATPKWGSRLQEDSAVEEAWELVGAVDSLAVDALRDYESVEARMFAAGVLHAAGLPDSAQAVMERAHQAATPEVDPHRELLSVEAIIRSRMGETQRAVALVQDYLLANPGHSFDRSAGLAWWWRELEAVPEFRRLIALRSEQS